MQPVGRASSPGQGVLIREGREEARRILTAEEVEDAEGFGCGFRGSSGQVSAVGESAGAPAQSTTWRKFHAPVQCASVLDCVRCRAAFSMGMKNGRKTGLRSGEVGAGSPLPAVSSANHRIKAAPKTVRTHCGTHGVTRPAGDAASWCKWTECQPVGRGGSPPMPGLRVEIERRHESACGVVGEEGFHGEAERSLFDGDGLEDGESIEIAFS